MLPNWRSSELNTRERELMLGGWMRRSRRGGGRVLARVCCGGRRAAL